MARVASERLRQAVGALDELDTSLRGVLRSLISYMVEDPRTISSCLDYLFVAKSFERIGDHATNIFEHVIYAVHGETCATPRLSPRSSHNGAGGAISLSQPGLTLA